MNLSDIRKKAQQEKAATAAVNPHPAGDVRTADSLPGENPAPHAAADLESCGIGESLPLPSTRTEAPPLREYDPLSVLLAGRAAACLTDGTASSASLAGEREESEFHELLCFRVAAEKYAVDIMDIKEIIKPREVTEVPRMPAFVSGVLSLRGVIIPVFSMHKRLGHGVVEKSGKERIIVVRMGEEFCGVLVDEVIQVAKLDAAAIEPPPAVLEGIDRDFVEGIGSFDGNMLILLNLEKILDMNLF
jgi:purine-binding chemotaxis protein CheW